MDNKKLENKADNKKLETKLIIRKVIKEFCGIRIGTSLTLDKHQYAHMVKGGYVKK